MAITAAALAVQVGYEGEAVDRGLAHTDRSVQSFAGGLGSLGGIGTVAFAAIGAGAVAAGAGLFASVGAASEFQAVLSEVGAVSGATGAQLEGLTALALQMGAETSFSAKEAALAMAELAKGGLSVETIMGGGLAGTLALAAAGGLSLSEAATIAADSLNIFGLAGSDMGMVADVLASAANVSSVSVQDLAQSLKYVGPPAAALGIPFTDLNGALALLGANGLKGSEAGTGLRTMLLGLAAPTDKARDLMGELGMSFFDAEGKMKPLSGIAQELQDKLSGMSEQQRIATLQTLFGKEGMSAAIAIMKGGGPAMDDWINKVSQQGAAQEVARKKLDNFKGSMEALKGSVETAAISLGLVLLPLLRPLVDAITAGVNAVLPFIEQYGPQLASAIQTGIGALVSFGQTVWAAISSVVGAFLLLQQGQISLAQFLGGLQIWAMTILANLGTFAAQVGGHLLGLATRFATFLVDALPAALTALTQLFFGLVNGITGQGGPAVEASMAQNMPSAFSRWVAPAIPPLLAALGQLFAALGTWIVTSAPIIGAQLIAWGQAFVAWVEGTAVPWLMPKLAALLTAIGNWIVGTALPAVVNWLVQVGRAFGAWVTETALPYLQANVPLWLNALGTWLSGTVLPAAKQWLIEVGQAFGTWVTETAVPWLQANVPIWLAALGNWLTGTALPAAQQWLIEMGQAFGTWVTETAIPWLQTNIPLWGAALSNWVLNEGLPQAIVALTELAKAFGNWVVETAIPWLAEKIPTWLAALEDFIRNTATPKAVEVAQNMGKKLVTSLMEAIQDTPERVKALMELVRGVLQSKLAEAVTNAATEMISLKDKITSALIGLAIDVVAGALGVGSAIVDGIARGIAAGAGAIADAARDAAMAALDAAKRALGIRSPSTAFAEVGRYSAEGFVEGLVAQQPQIGRAVADTFGGLARPVGSDALLSQSVMGSRVGQGLGSSRSERPITMIVTGNTLLGSDRQVQDQLTTLMVPGLRRELGYDRA